MSALQGFDTSQDLAKELESFEAELRELQDLTRYYTEAHERIGSSLKEMGGQVGAMADSFMKTAGTAAQINRAMNKPLPTKAAGAAVALYGVAKLAEYGLNKFGDMKKENAEKKARAKQAIAIREMKEARQAHSIEKLKVVDRMTPRLESIKNKQIELTSRMWGRTWNDIPASQRVLAMREAEEIWNNLTRTVFVYENFIHAGRKLRAWSTMSEYRGWGAPSIHDAKIESAKTITTKFRIPDVNQPIELIKATPLGMLVIAQGDADIERIAENVHIDTWISNVRSAYFSGGILSQRKERLEFRTWFAEHIFADSYIYALVREDQKRRRMPWIVVGVMLVLIAILAVSYSL